MYTFRFVLMLILTTLAASYCIKIFLRYKINYIFIMDLDPHKKITHIQMFRVRALALPNHTIGLYLATDSLELLSLGLTLRNQVRDFVSRPHCHFHSDMPGPDPASLFNTMELFL